MHITIIEDEKLLSEKISKKLKNYWFSISIFNDIESFNKSSLEDTDLYIIDLFLKDWLWFDIISNLRNKKFLRTPIIMISWLESAEKRIQGLNLWADDFLTKPFTPDELIARINAIIRRNNNSEDLKADINYKNIVYKYQEHKVLKDNIEVVFRPKEKQLIEYFLRNPWKIITKNYLIKEIWWEYNKNFVTDNTINVTICKIRKKLGNEFKLETIHSEWYKLKN